MNTKKQLKVLFVCMGNICRSPTAEAVFRKQVADKGLQDRIVIDSAGTHAYHIGHPPDARSAETARERGLDMSKQRARRVEYADLQDFDYVLAMDSNNLMRLQAMQDEQGGNARVGLLLEYAKGASVNEVPDPYYGGPGGFDRVFDLVEAGCQGLLHEVEQHLDSL